MVKLSFCVRRRGDLPPEEFHRYWRHEHGPLVARHAPALGIRRYVQSHTLESELNAGLRASRGAEEPFDGVAELWWDSAEELTAVLDSEKGRQVGLELLEDERKFIDLARSSLFLTEEHEIVAPGPSSS